jgi:hypothetical protein
MDHGVWRRNPAVTLGGGPALSPHDDAMCWRCQEPHPAITQPKAVTADPRASADGAVFSVSYVASILLLGQSEAIYVDISISCPGPAESRCTAKPWTGACAGDTAGQRRLDPEAATATCLVALDSPFRRRRVESLGNRGGATPLPDRFALPGGPHW